MRRGLLALAFVAPLLAGCANLQREAPPAAQDGDLRLSGRLSVQVSGRGGDSAAFELLGSPEAGRLELSTPLGSLVARARWSRAEVLLQTPREERRFEDLDSLTREMLGEPVPVAALFDWLRGRPWPRAGSQPLEGAAQGFAQLGWQIDLSRFGDGLIVANRPAEPAVTLRARLDP
ncbi:outer membrane lipoprotein LolB [Roseateles sp. DAIF2]|uniref:outer membrane lipoprotein LolB n=1 Tax=Roseateles sp. DAIF2 TaxID=2714952 RepID=UPI0018A2A0F2|nr:outer membrane lipoprotein LolB [Roseateles sp. DAIF2]QPF75423.1 outer membrane lipoprotein LolB [Roseateles sp. DAIF2]